MPQNVKLPSLALLRCFEAAAKYQSFTAAAQELGMSQGAVSRHIKDLESYVGAALFRREGRGVRLTAAGESLSQQLFVDLDRLRQTFSQAIATGERRQLFRIAAPPTFSSRWLVPRLKAFREKHPDIEFMLQSRSDPFDLSEERVDLAIHFGAWDWPGAQLTPLCPENLVVVASPDLVKDGNGNNPAAIRELPLLHQSGRVDLWSRYFQSVGFPTDGLRSGSYFDQFSLVISAAVAGMGAAILPTYLIETELRDGSLRQLASLPEDTSRSYIIATPMTAQDALTHDFIVWVKGQVSRRVTALT